MADIVEEAERLSEAATPGPWEYDAVITDYVESPHRVLPVARDVHHDGDGRFIARARTLVPDLVAEVKRLRADYARVHEDGRNAYEALSDAAKERDELRARLATVESASREAITEFRDALPYVPDYFREKWGYDETIERLSALLLEGEAP